MTILRRHPFVVASVVLAAACGAYLLAGGIRPNAPFLFLVVAALVLELVVALVFRAAIALVREPAPEQVKVATGRRRKELEREKQGLLKALKELSFDHEMHKVSDGDYRDIAALYRARAVRVMRQLDDSALEYRGMVERDLAARRAERPSTLSRVKAVAAAVPVVEGGGGAPRKRSPIFREDPTEVHPIVDADGVVKDAPAEAAGPKSEPAASTEQPATVAEPVPPSRATCDGCGTSNEPDAAFCKRCGQRLAAEATT